jgi:hypothetical protein
MILILMATIAVLKKKERILWIDTLRAKAAEILGSTSPLSLDPLQYLNQRWFSPQALTFPLPGGSCIVAKFD